MKRTQPTTITEQTAMRDLRQRLGSVIKREAGVTVVAPKVLTSQQARSDALALKFANSPAYRTASSGPAWFLNYSGDLTPQCADLAWTADITSGCGSAVLSGATFELTDMAAGGHAAYWYDSATLSNSAGVTFEAKLLMVSADTAAGSGFLMRIEDGTKSFDLYVRTGDLNVSGDAVYSHDLSAGFHTLRMVSRTADVAVYLDGNLVTSGAATGDTTLKRLTWGTRQNRDADTALVRVLRIRAADRKA